MQYTYLAIGKNRILSTYDVEANDILDAMRNCLHKDELPRWTYTNDVAIRICTDVAYFIIPMLKTHLEGKA